MAQLPSVGDQFGRYRIDTQIGYGGMGVVFAATDLSFDRRVALKVLSAGLGDSREFQRRFEREAALLGRLSSPHVIDIFDYGVQDGCPYIATQYVGGGDLGGLITARGAMPPQLAARVCAQVADGLHDAHRIGVVHRDVKPSNVLLRDADTLDLHAYLCDFGIARTDSDGLTAPGSVTGTWSYLSPECGKGAPGATSSDVYALGCLFWATLTGHAPFRGTDVEIAVAHQRAPVPQLAADDAFTRQANLILSRSLAKQPEDRYADADQMRSGLLAAAGLHSSGIQPAFQPQPGLPGPPLTPTPSGQHASFGRAPPSAPPSGPPSLPPMTTPAPYLPRRSPDRRRTVARAAAVSLAAVVVAGGIWLAAQVGPWSGTGPTGPGDGDPSGKPATDVVGPVTGDVDGDGYGDLVLTLLTQPEGGTPDDSTRQLTTWLSDGTTFGERETVDDAATETSTLRRRVSGDFDGDGVVEVLVVEEPESHDELRLAGELSDGEAVDTSVARPATEGPATGYSGDVDGDGRDDLVVLTSQGKDFTVSVSLSDAAGGFSRLRRELTITAPPIYLQLEVGDYDGDRVADVATLTTDTTDTQTTPQSTLALYRGDGDGFERDGTSREFSSGYLPSLATGDFDGDEDDELLFLPGDDENLLTLNVVDYDDVEGLSRPEPWGVLNPESQDARFTGLGISDADGDGRDDVVNVDPARRSGPTIISVSLSTATEFESATEWGRWPAVSLRGNIPQILGSTYP